MTYIKKEKQYYNVEVTEVIFNIMLGKDNNNKPLKFVSNVEMKTKENQRFLYYPKSIQKITEMDKQENIPVWHTEVKKVLLSELETIFKELYRIVKDKKKVNIETSGTLYNGKNGDYILLDSDDVKDIIIVKE